jgi:DNA-binding NarL/FixJ family response regulator
VRAIHEVVEGRRYLSPPLSERAIEKYMLSINDDGSDPYESLTDREREIFQMVAEGMTNKEVAELLVISPRTVETHRTSFMRKLNLKSRTDLIRFALRRGILPQQE